MSLRMVLAEKEELIEDINSLKKEIVEYDNIDIVLEELKKKEEQTKYWMEFSG